MNARPLLTLIAKIFNKHHLEAVLIGNAAAALHGAPVTTIDIDFMFRETSANLSKIRAISKELNAMVMRPYYPASNLYRITRDSDNLQIDLMSRIHGVKSLASLRSRAQEVTFGSFSLLVASLEDIIKSKKVAGRKKDKAVLELLEVTLKEQLRLRKNEEKKDKENQQKTKSSESAKKRE